jgi:transcription elongation factor
MKCMCCAKTTRNIIGRPVATAINAMAWNAGINAMAWNAGINAMAWNAGINAMAWNAGINAMAWNAGINAAACCYCRGTIVYPALRYQVRQIVPLQI